MPNSPTCCLSSTAQAAGRAAVLFAVLAGTSTAAVAAPTVSIEDRAPCSEGNSGYSNCSFTVRLSQTWAQAVSGSFGAGSADTDFAEPYVDFEPTPANPNWSIAAGQTTTTVTIRVSGDVLDEDDETFYVELADLVNAAASGNDLRTTVAIADNDAPPTATLDPCTVVEGSGGAPPQCETRLRLSRPSGREVGGVFQVTPYSALVYSAFETPAIAGPFQTLASGQTVDGWSVESGSIDLVTDAHWLTVEGRQSLDLNGSAPGTLRHDLTTANGINYEIWFAKAANPGCGAGVKHAQALLGNQVLGEIQHEAFAPPDYGNLGWAYEHFTVTGTGNTRALRFAGLDAGSCGITLDHVAVLAAGNAMPDVDVSLAPFDMLVAPGETASAPILFDIAPDTEYEPDERFRIVAISTSNLGTVTAAIGTIVNDDLPVEIFASSFE